MDAFLLSHNLPSIQSPPCAPSDLFLRHGISCIFEGSDADTAAPGRSITDLLALLSAGSPGTDAAAEGPHIFLSFYRGAVEREFTGLPMAVPLERAAEWSVRFAGDMDGVADLLIAMARMASGLDGLQQDGWQSGEDGDDRPCEAELGAEGGEGLGPPWPARDPTGQTREEDEGQREDSLGFRLDRKLFGHAGRPGASCVLHLSDLVWVGEDHGQFDPHQPPRWATGGKAELVVGSKSAELVFEGAGLRFTSLFLTDTILIKEKK